jgi:hypothetical protein
MVVSAAMTMKPIARSAISEFVSMYEEMISSRNMLAIFQIDAGELTESLR